MVPLGIAQRRLLSQHLIGAGWRRPGDAVKGLVAVQAQDYAGAKWALGLRLAGATDKVVEHAFATGAILRTHLLRPTWHFITPDDIRWVLALTAPRVHAVNAHRYRQLGLDAATLRRGNAALAKALQGGRQLTRDELRGVLLKTGLGTYSGQRMTHLMMHAELERIVCSGPRRGRQFTYALFDERVPATKSVDRVDARCELAHRFFSSRGPASVQDFAKWSGLTAADARSGLEGARGRLESEVLDKKTYWFAPPSRGRAAKSPSPSAHLLSIYDEYISGYRDRSAMIDPRHAPRVWSQGNALSYIVVVNGRVVGTWKRRIDQGTVVIRTEMFGRLTKSEQQAVAAAAAKYASFLEMPVVQER